MTVQLNQQGYANVLLSGEMSFDKEIMVEDMGMGEEVMGETSTGNSLMSSYLFVIGITAVTLTLSIVLGILLAKKRIKKGFDLYED